MQKQIIVSVLNRGDGDFGPDYALITTSGDVCPLRERMDVTNDLAVTCFGGLDERKPGSGSLFTTEWWLRHLPLNVKWLRYAALTDEDGDELDTDWMGTLQEEGWVAIEGFEPRLGGLDRYGSHDNEFVSVDAETVRMFPTGNMTVDAVVDGTSKAFFTEEFPMTSLVGAE